MFHIRIVISNNQEQFTTHVFERTTHEMIKKLNQHKKLKKEDERVDVIE